MRAESRPASGGERDIFAGAFQIADRAERDAYVRHACGGDDTLRGRVERLLAAHDTATTLLDRPARELLETLVREDRPGGPDADPTAEAVGQLAPFLAPAGRPEAFGRLGRYDLLAVLGRGGYGVVVKAVDTTLDRVVAVKVLAPALAATSPPRKRFLREARAAARVRHENVVQIHAVEEDPLPFLVMEYVAGQTLQERLDAAGPFDPAEVVAVGRQVALGLAAAHEQGLVHRDVKPANILLEAGPGSRVKLTDFGLARTADDASLSQSGVIVGTPLYMAPEQVQGHRIDPRTDLFSLGSVLYTMTAGHPPFRAANTFAILKRVAEAAPRPLPEVIPEVPRGLAAVIGRLLARRPDDRFPTARAAADALGGCLTAPPARRRVTPARAAAVAGLLAVAGLVWAVAVGQPLAGPVASDPPAEERAPAVAAVEPAPTILVTSPEDDDRPGTLRWAVAQANSRPGEDAIAFDPAAFAARRSVTLTRGPLVLTDPARTTVRGPAAGLTVSGGGKGRVFEVGRKGRPAPARLADLTIADGRVEYEGSEEERQGLGGGLLCWTGSAVELTGCTVRDNLAYSGGGLFNFDGTVTLTNCTIARNSAKGLNLDSGQRDGDGGGVKNYGKAGKLTVVHCTFTGNEAENGGGALMTNGYSRTEVFNSLFYENVGWDITTVFGSTDGDHNVTGDGSAPGSNSKTNVDMILGDLGDNGGPTETVLPPADSPTVGAGDPAHVPPGVTTDQRGRPRVTDGRVDVGACQRP